MGKAKLFDISRHVVWCGKSTSECKLIKRLLGSIMNRYPSLKSI